MSCNDNCLKVVRVTELFEDGAFSVITPNLPAGSWQHDDGQGTLTVIRSVSGDLGNGIVAGSDGGAYISSATISALVGAVNRSVITNALGAGGNNRVATHDDGAATIVDIYETGTTMTNVVAGHRIGTYTNENGAAVDIDEIITSFSSVIPAGSLIAVYNDEDGGTTTLYETVTDLSVSGASDPTVTYTDEAGATDTVQFVGGTNITVTQAADVITINTSAVNSFTITDGVTPQTVVDGDTITFAAGGDVTVATSATDTVTYSFTETTTSISQSTSTGIITYTDEDAGGTNVIIISTDASNALINGTDGGLWLGVSTGLDVASGILTVDVDDFMADGADNRVLTATGLDTFHGEANLLFDGNILTTSSSVVLRDSNAPASGAYVDIYRTGTNANYIRAYNFTGAAYEALYIDADDLWLNNDTKQPVHVGGDGSGGVLALNRVDTTVVADDALGTIHFEGSDGGYSSVDASVVISGHASEAQGVGEKGGYLKISTKADGTDENQAATERVRVDQDGSLDFKAYGGGTFAGTGTYYLAVDGSGNVVEENIPNEVPLWTEVTGTSQAGAVNNSYIANNAGLVTITLPATASVGDTIRFVGKGAGLYKVGQNAGQTIHVSGNSTTTGVTGSLTAVNQYDAIELVCITTNTDWAAVSSVGTFTIA